MTGFRKRTTHGMHALSAAVVRKAVAEPERVAYLVIADLNIVSSLFGWSTPKKITKPVLMPLLAGHVLRSGASDRAAGMLALAGGWAGDLALMKPNNIPTGAAGFAINHAAYVYLLLTRGARPSAAKVAIRAVPLAAATTVAAWKAPKLLPVVFGYGGLLAATSTLAADPALINPKQPATCGLGHGGNLFLLSDAVLLIRETLLTPGTVAAHLADAVVMDTYTGAQRLLIDGLFPTAINR